MYINKTDASLFISPRAAEAPVPEEDHEDDLMEDERDGGSPDPHDDADFGFDHAALQHLSDGALDPLAAFIQELLFQSAQMKIGASIVH